MQKRMAVLALMIAGVAACRPSDVLSVPAPDGVLSGSALQNQTGAESIFNAAKAQLFAAADGPQYNGILGWSEVLSDEFTYSGFTFYPASANVDARRTAGDGVFLESADQPWSYLMQARTSLILSIPELVSYESGAGRAKIGEAYALLGYAEILAGEDYCAGTPLSEIVPGGGIQYGMPLTTDSLLAIAQGHFDSAIAEANSDPTTTDLAYVGLARTLLDRGQLAAAATAASNVPVNFVYNAELEPAPTAPPYSSTFYGDGVANAVDVIFNVANREGTNGLDFISAHDPRLVLDSTTYQTEDGAFGGVVPGAWYLPVKFESNLSYVPLATGVEAALIVAEAALQTDSATWIADLNALRAAAPSTYLALASGMAPLTDPGSDTARVSLMFRERAFWLFGTGTRLGDLRRLIRQYQRDQSVVFPTGTYANGYNTNLPLPLPTYGTDVNLTLPTPQGFGSLSNPNYKGCITSTTTA